MLSAIHSNSIPWSFGTPSFKGNNSSLQSLFQQALQSPPQTSDRKITLYTGCLVSNGYVSMKYDQSSTSENPVIFAWGTDENGKPFERKIYINDIDPKNATPAELEALYAHYRETKQPLPDDVPPYDMGLLWLAGSVFGPSNTKVDFTQLFQEWSSMLKQQNYANPIEQNRFSTERYLFEMFHQRK